MADSSSGSRSVSGLSGSLCGSRSGSGTHSSSGSGPGPGSASTLLSGSSSDSSSGCKSRSGSGEWTCCCSTCDIDLSGDRMRAIRSLTPSVRSYKLGVALGVGLGVSLGAGLGVLRRGVEISRRDDRGRLGVMDTGSVRPISSCSNLRTIASKLASP